MPTKNGKVPGSYQSLIDALLLVLVVLGTLGSVWVSDDFDAYRLPSLGWVGMPLACFYFSFRLLYPDWPRKLPVVGRVVLTTLFLLFGVGTATLVNALTSDGVVFKRTVDQGRGLAVRDVKRGGLGVLFQTRF